MAGHGANHHGAGGQPPPSPYDRRLDPGSFLRPGSDTRAALAEIKKKNILRNLEPQNIFNDWRTGSVTFTGYTKVCQGAAEMLPKEGSACIGKTFRVSAEYYGRWA